MRLIHVTSVHVWQDTRIFHRMCRGLSRLGHQVVLFAPEAPGCVVDGIETRTLPCPRSRLIRALVVAPQAIIGASRENGDVIHLHDPELIPWGQFLRLAGKTVVFDMHEYLPGAITTKPWIPRSLRGILSRIWAVLERILLAGMPTVLAEKSYEKHYSWIRSRETILNLPDSEYLLNRDLSSSELKRVVYVGRVTEERGSLVTLRALGLLQRRGYEVGYTCVGKASMQHQTELDELVNTLGLTNVVFTGYLPPSEAIEKISAGSIGLAVLQRTRNYEESYPTKMFEYMALGMPVIVSDFPLYREVVMTSGCGLCVDPKSAEDLSDAIERLLSDSELARDMGERGKAAIRKRYDWSSQLVKLDRFYCQVSG